MRLGIYPKMKYRIINPLANYYYACICVNDSFPPRKYVSACYCIIISWWLRIVVSSEYYRHFCHLICSLETAFGFYFSRRLQNSKNVTVRLWRYGQVDLTKKFEGLILLVFSPITANKPVRSQRVEAWFHFYII